MSVHAIVALVVLVGAWVREVFASDDVLSQLRVVQQAVPLLETPRPVRARGACARARFVEPV